MIKVSDIFDCVYGCNLELYKLKEDPNGIPFVSRTSRNNGVATRVLKLKNIKTNPAHTISVSCGGSVMECFYQEKEYYSGRDLYYLQPKIKLNMEQMIFYASALSSNRYKFSYGRQVNKSLPNLRIPKLDNFDKKLYTNKKFSSNFFKKSDFNFTNSIDNIRYKKISEIFDPHSGLASSQVERFEEKLSVDHIPYVRPTKDQRYSIDAYVNKKKIDDKYIFPCETLYVSTDGQGSHTYSYVSIFDFVPNSNVTVLIPKRKMSLIEKLFYSFCITKHRYKFSYGRKPKGDRLKNILVPEYLNINNVELLNKFRNMVN